MKPLSIIGVVAIAFSIGVILSTFSDSSTYADFNTAFAHPGNEFHVIGTLNRGKEQVYDPMSNANEFIFFMNDTAGVERKVILSEPKPQDFERSEKIVLIGKAKGESFHASKVLMKCPSKYNDGSQEI
ncbi:MAG: cytochrome C biogenesis protein [Flavobacteriales bacterium]|nr:MAG: cytochrome C biogenesis protein [Flavobacteriales bacterium]